MRTLTAWLLVGWIFSVSAAAQGGWGAVQGIPLNTSVRVVTTTQATLSSIFQMATDDTLVLMDEGTIRYVPRQAVQQVGYVVHSGTDDTKKGFLIGLGAGLPLGLVAVQGGGPKIYPLAVATWAATGALIGHFTSHPHSEFVVVYRATP